MMITKDDNMLQKPVAIIGAGLAGLALGHCLRKRGVSAVLFEKTSKPARSDYGITLYGGSYLRLLRVLEPFKDPSQFRQDVGIDTAAAGLDIDWSSPSIKTPLVVEDSADASTGQPFRVHRSKLERYLRESLDIRWGHAIENIKITSERTTLCFSNGNFFEASLVVACDGIHSTVRNLLLQSSSKPSVLPYVAFNGRRRITLSLYHTLLPPDQADGVISKIMKSNKVRLEVSLFEHHKADNTVYVSYTYSRPARVDQPQADPLYQPTRSTSGATKIPLAFYTELAELQPLLAEPWAELFDPGKVQQDRVLSWLMRSISVPQAELQALARKKVVLIGDAAHGTPILGSTGANEALLDALMVDEHIAGQGAENLVELYSPSRCSRWQKCVVEGEKRLAAMHEGGASGERQSLL